MTIDPAISLTPTLPIDALSNSVSLAGATQPQKLHAACKAIEGLFAGQLLSEMGKGLDIAGTTDGAEGQYSDFIQQALAQQVTSGKGFGLAAMLEKSLTPAAHAHLNALTAQLHAATTPPTAR
jgi:Rod binding domain-containing protein